MESIINAFHIDYKIILAQMVNFGIVFVVLYFYAIKPLGKIMKERGDKIEKGVKDAKTNAEILDKSKAEYEEILIKAKSEADKIFQEGKKEAQTKKTAMLEEAKNEVALIIENGKKTLEADKTKMVEEAKKEIVTLVISATKKLLGEKIDGSLNEKTIKEFNNL
ncbi:MAG: ATP synthase subunit b [Candidatus Nomurabacteria bacterium GW2011_GWF2_40_12]|uniref:ATP synthase subunit b n=1 Tax=Candidatus Nomurabacteria bacterium GW2011_GWF2_40_12 TaxID=1618776 RepID=A0A0G0U163_9BACT|nr:MAG: ATP synthase subunit b [Candidatus Nomurabacteria bacterium GW2011_GWF2_40_12]